MDQLNSAIDFLFASVFSEAFSIFFLGGFVFFLVGLLLAGLFFLSRILGTRTVGVVVGAVEHKRTKRKERNGEVIEKVKTSLYPVYEYQASDGTTRQMRGSEGGTMTLKYKTGQKVNLIVREDDGYDDVYDAGEFGALYIGLFFLVIGLLIMVWVGSMASAFGVGVTSLVLLIVARGVGALFLRGKKPRSTRAPRGPYNKAFDPEELRPVEDYL